MEPNTNYLYRYEDIKYSLGVDEYDEPIPGCTIRVNKHQYAITKRTPKGAWIKYGFDKKFVLLTARKKYACLTSEEALESFKARKQRQIAILDNNIRNAKRALQLADSVVI